jgi:hypothetical protein
MNSNTLTSLDKPQSINLSSTHPTNVVCYLHCWWLSQIEFVEIMKKSQERYDKEQKARVEAEAKKILERDWRNNYWRRNQTISEEEYMKVIYLF